MLPSSYTRRLRTHDLIRRNFPDTIERQTTKSSSKTVTRFDLSSKKLTHEYLPRLHRERTRTHQSSRVSGQINRVLERLSENDKKEKQEQDLYRRKLQAVFYKEKRDTPVPPPKLEKQYSRLSLRSKQRLQAIEEQKEPSAPVHDTLENLTKERMVVLAKNLIKNKAFLRSFKRNPNRMEILQPVLYDGIPAWSQESKKELVILVPIKSIRFIKWKYSVKDAGYIEVELPKKIPRVRSDAYEAFRAEDEVHLSASLLNKALVAAFVESLRVTKLGEFTLAPTINFDYLNDTVELVYTKQLRIPLIPAISLSSDDPLYVIRPNYPDIDPTSDTLFRACFLQQEERILNKISSTDHGLRFDALKVIHTLCKQDWRLQAITVYQLKNVLMHDIDFEIDHSPRWQRLTRDICVQSILKRLLYFVKKRNLPHFFQSELNLFKYIPEKYLTFMHTPLERLVSNEQQLLRDLQRASRGEDVDSDTSSDSDEDWW